MMKEAERLRKAAAQLKPRHQPKGTAAPRMPVKQHRMRALENVFAQFDLDDSGSVEADELLALGRTRRGLGQKHGVWTEKRNERVVRAMDKTSEGMVQKQDFVEYFSDMLPQDPEVFEETIAQFQAVAKVTRFKLESRRVAREALRTQQRKLTQSQHDPSMSTCKSPSARNSVPSPEQQTIDEVMQKHGESMIKLAKRRAAVRFKMAV